MSNTFGTVVEFTPAAGVEVNLHAARPSKIAAIEVGEQYYTAASEGNEEFMDALLDECGPVLVRRGLRAFGNTVNRMGHKEVAAAALVLRDEIKAVPANRKSA
jgi:hypothetical protein